MSSQPSLSRSPKFAAMVVMARSRPAARGMFSECAVVVVAEEMRDGGVVGLAELECADIVEGLVE